MSHMMMTDGFYSFANNNDLKTQQINLMCKATEKLLGVEQSQVSSLQLVSFQWMMLFE